MSPWRLDERKEESPGSRAFENAVAVLATVAAVGSLFVSRPPGSHILVYLFLGVIAGILREMGGAAGFLSLAVVVFAVQFVPAWLIDHATPSNAAWWQPSLIVVAAVFIVHLAEFVTPRFRHVR